jgi:DNA replication protein DnaC
VDPYLFSELVGQDLAVQQACDAICDYLAKKEPQKPLVLSAHGPPGVGKTFMHLLLARALCSKKPSEDLECPGKHCLGYKVPITEMLLLIQVCDHISSVI